MSAAKTSSTDEPYEFEYLRLASAAELLGCTIEQLLHLGAIGKATLLAPVIATGEYEWPVDGAGAESWREPFRATFDASDRVILHRRDVATIEATGWVIPRLFFSPDVAHQIAESFNVERQDDEISIRRLPKEVTRVEDGRARRQSHRNEVNIAQLIKLVAPRTGAAVAGDADAAVSEMSAYQLMIQHADTVPWFPVDMRRPIEVLQATTVPSIEDKKDNRTTVDHLFVSRSEIERLKEHAPQDAAAERRGTATVSVDKKHGRSNRASSNREQVLLAAIACYFGAVAPDAKPPKGTAWAQAVDDKSRLFWRTGCPPLSRDEIERLLRSAMEYPAQADWEGGMVEELPTDGNP